MALDFLDWWRDFLASPHTRNAKDGGHTAAAELTRYVARLSTADRDDFTDELARLACAHDEGWGIALAALEQVGTSRAVHRIAAHVAQTRGSAHLGRHAPVTPFLRVLARSADPQHQELVAAYLLGSELDSQWPDVPWALWPSQQNLFGRSWARYFANVPPDVWRNSVIAQTFVADDQALACVRNALEPVDTPAWLNFREAVLSKLRSPWLSTEQREAVRLVCRDAA
jgi:hypothetical protein